MTDVTLALTPGPPRPPRPPRPCGAAMTARRVVVLLVFAFGVYVLLLGERAVALLRDPRLVLKVLGVGVLLLPVVGVVMVVKELRFGQEAERLARPAGG